MPLLEIRAWEESDVPGRLSFFPSPCMVKNENGSRGVSAGDVSMSTDNMGLCEIGESGFRV